MNYGPIAGLPQTKDDEFVAAFEACTLPNEQFRHRDHLRLAWIYLRRFGASGAEARIAQSIRRYAEFHGATQKYHHTVTLAWLRLIQRAAARLPEQALFEDVLRASPELLDKGTLGEYYSKELVGSERARADFVEPDLKPLP